MPATSMELVADTSSPDYKNLPSDCPPGLRHFPFNLAEWGKQLGKDQRAIAADVGVNASTISRWLHWQGVYDMKAKYIIKLEEAWGLDPGTLTRPHVATGRKQSVDKSSHSDFVNQARRKVSDGALPSKGRGKG